MKVQLLFLALFLCWEAHAFSSIHGRSVISSLQMSKDGDKSSDSDSIEPKKRKGLVPFFGRLSRSRNKLKETPSSASDEKDMETTLQVLNTEAPVSSPSPDPKDPAELAKILRAQAKRSRLEAERMDAELTLAKIEKLEGRLTQATAKGEAVDDLVFQLENLQAKLRGEQPKPAMVSVTKTPGIELGTSTPLATTEAVPDDTFPAGLILGNDFNETLQLVEESPGFMKKLMATLVECDFDSIDDINSTEIARRVSLMNMGDFSYSNLPKPAFGRKRIEDQTEKIQQMKIKGGPSSYPKQFVEMAGNNLTKLALYYLDYDYYVNSRIDNDEDVVDVILKVGEGEEWMKPLLEAINQTAIDRSIETLYPKCMRKEGVQEPTMAQIQMLFSTVLPQAKFTSTSKPEKVLGGFIIRGNHGCESADDFIETIDKELERANLANKMTVFYAPDFTVLLKEEEDLELALFEEQQPILYVTSSDVTRDRQRILLSITSAFGLATSWYLSIFPLLLNPGLAKRVEDQLALADASMGADLDWLTELSLPLFVTFLGIQFAHELAHRLVAAAYRMEITFPTLVPSLITGTTSTVTSFKEPPKNKEAMFDFAIAGPLVGIVASLAAITVGSQLTLISDPATLPALPIEILRQSTLGGSIIDGIVKGSLYVPSGAQMSGILINLHPVAIAGYISLVINALSLLPIGTTDGGRVGLVLFGRPAKLVVGNLFMFILLLTGLLSSELFLFYFSFIIAFQTGNEIPARNETDNISFPRVILAIAAYCLAFLSLVPFQ